MCRNIGCLLVILFMFAGCGDKKKPSLTGTDKVVISDFIESFELIKPPYEVADTMLNRKEKDSLLIGNAIFAQFVPDSVLQKVLGKKCKAKDLPRQKSGNRKRVVPVCKSGGRAKENSLGPMF